MDYFLYRLFSILYVYAIYLSFYISFYISIYLSIFLSIYLSINLSIFPSIFPSIYHSIYLPFYQSFFLSIPSFIYISIFLSLSIYIIKKFYPSCRIFSTNKQICLLTFVHCQNNYKIIFKKHSLTWNILNWSVMVTGGGFLSIQRRIKRLILI